MAKFRISYNAPVVLTFALLAVAVFVLCSEHVAPNLRLWFVASPHLGTVQSYVGMVSYILGHASWQHLLGNFMLILLIGPILEERHGSLGLLIMIVVTAICTGFANLAFSGNALMGASGVVFMMILLASMSNIRSGEIPLTFIAVALVYMGGELVHAFRADGISHMAHLIGGTAGATFGFLTAKRRALRPADLKKLPI